MTLSALAAGQPLHGPPAAGGECLSSTSGDFPEKTNSQQGLDQFNCTEENCTEEISIRPAVINEC